ncbi:MAG TPA: hypothetical protein VFP18_13680, partial [Candidatus Binatia bacterium]|nr:hypothetical protein [Candidatus Binatia bacterium]
MATHHCTPICQKDCLGIETLGTTSIYLGFGRCFRAQIRNFFGGEFNEAESLKTGTGGFGFCARG